MKMPYELENLEFSNPVLRKVDVTYVITMRNSTRRTKYIRQLYEARPTTNVVIVHNEGYKGGRKPAWVVDSSSDLWHANLFVFQLHLKTRGPKPFLVLEDDCEFEPEFQRLGHTIEQFVSSGGAEMYLLGGIPLVSAPHDLTHVRVLAGICAHAVLYSASGAEKALLLPVRGEGHDLVFASELRTFMSRTPLAIQKFSKTENSDAWRLWGVPTSWLALSYFSAFGADRDARRLFEFHHSLADAGGLWVVLGVGSAVFLLLFSVIGRREVP